MLMTRDDALPYVALGVTDALSEHAPSEAPRNARLVGWHCGFEPLFVAVWSYFGASITDAEAIELATDLLAERKWFAGEPTAPDCVL